jgi:hypothetical protein
MFELIFAAILIGAGLLYAIFATHPYSFDDLVELRFLPSRRRPKYDIEEIRAKINPRGDCLRKGQVNNPWGHQRCECTGFRFQNMYYGQAQCECGDLYLQHAPIGSGGKHEDPTPQEI